MIHTTETLMAMAFAWRLAGSASCDEHEDSLCTALTDVIQDRDTLHQQLAEALVAARYAEHIDATPENQRETMLYDTIKERDTLRQQLAESQALIEASRKESLEMAAKAFETQHTWLTNISVANLIRALAKEIK